VSNWRLMLKILDRIFVSVMRWPAKKSCEMKYSNIYIMNITDLTTVHEQDHGLKLVMLVGRDSKYFVEVSVHIMLLSARE